MTWLDFFKTKVAWKQIGLMGLIFLGVMVVCFFFLGLFTRHGQAIIVPNLEGRLMSELTFMEKDYGFKFVVRDSVFDPDIVPGTILNQTPKANSKVKKQRTFYLVVSASKATMIAMPNLKDLSLRQCSSLLETYGLKIGKISYSPSLAKNAVLEQLWKGRSIEPGSEILKGSVIDLVVGGGSSASMADSLYDNTVMEDDE